MRPTAEGGCIPSFDVAGTGGVHENNLLIGISWALQRADTRKEKERKPTDPMR
jgi:hypothetical protein